VVVCSARSEGIRIVLSEASVVIQFEEVWQATVVNFLWYGRPTGKVLSSVCVIPSR